LPTLTLRGRRDLCTLAGRVLCLWKCGATSISDAARHIPSKDRWIRAIRRKETMLQVSIAQLFTNSTELLLFSSPNKSESCLELGRSHLAIVHLAAVHKSKVAGMQPNESPCVWWPKGKKLSLKILRVNFKRVQLPVKHVQTCCNSLVFRLPVYIRNHMPTKTY
jgi:hypothetical protein